MCNRYVSPAADEIERYWHAGARSPWRGGPVFPRAPGAFVRAAGGGGRELVVGRWGLLPWFAKTATPAYSTNNARFEELERKPSYREPWRRGQRCLIPAWSFDEPCWESGRNVWWSFRRADGAPWALAGLWNTWTDRATGELVESYTMLTLNADAHPLLRRMHKPDPKLPADAQDKRSVVAIEAADVDAWLHGPPPQAAALVRLTPVAGFDAAPTAAAPRRQE